MSMFGFECSKEISTSHLVSQSHHSSRSVHHSSLKKPESLVGKVPKLLDKLHPLFTRYAVWEAAVENDFCRFFATRARCVASLRLR
jgi:hypothetical protein